MIEISMTTIRMVLILMLFPLFEGAAALQPTNEQPQPSLKVDKVIVHKSKRVLELISQAKVIKSYKVALGKSPQGHKQRRGDNKTPEGKYVLDWRHPKSTFYKSIHISYPNQEDRLRAAQKGVSPGGDIFLHGLPPSFSFLSRFHTFVDWTQGCIAVSNDEIDEIFKLVRDGTPIEIRP